MIGICFSILFIAGLQHIDSKTVEDVFKVVMQGEGEQGPGPSQTAPQQPSLPPVPHPAHPQEQASQLPGLQQPSQLPQGIFKFKEFLKKNESCYAF